MGPSGSYLGVLGASCWEGIGLPAVEAAYPGDKAVRVAGSLQIDLVVAVLVVAGVAIAHSCT